MESQHLSSPMGSYRRGGILASGALRSPQPLRKRPNSPLSISIPTQPVLPSATRSTPQSKPNYYSRLNNVENEVLDDKIGLQRTNWTKDSFIIGKPIGKGKFGNVYSAQLKECDDVMQSNTLRPKKFALKSTFKEQLQQECTGSSIQQLHNEVRIMQKLKHRNIVELYE